MNEIKIELKKGRSLARMVERISKSGIVYVAYVRDDFDSSNGNHLRDLVSEFGRAGVIMDVANRNTEDDLRRLKIDGGVERVRI